MGQLHIELLGASFTIQANEDDEYMQKLLGYYKRIVDDLAPVGTNKPLQTSILAGIMLCDELYREKSAKLKGNENQNEVQNIQESQESEELKEILLIADRLIEKIDGVL